MCNDMVVWKRYIGQHVETQWAPTERQSSKGEEIAPQVRKKNEEESDPTKLKF